MLARWRRKRPTEPTQKTSGRLPILSLIIVGVAATLTLADMLVTAPGIDGFGILLLDYAVIVAAFALILGLVHLVRVHARQVSQRREGWLNSLFLLGVTLFFAVIGIIEGPEGAITQWSVATVLLPLQGAFFSLLAFFLMSVLFRATRVRSFETFLLTGTALLVVIAGTPLGRTFVPWLESTRVWIMESVATAGARAILLGVAIGTIVTAFRFVADGRRLFK